MNKLKTLKHLPNIPGITPDTARNLKWKSLKYMATHDHDKKIRGHFLKHPFRYGSNLLRSLLKKKAYTKRDGDFYFFRLPSFKAFKKRLKKPNALLVVGFSYCHKPHECPSKRFTPDCIHNPDHPVCKQCFIGQTINALPPEKTTPLIIPTIHYIGDKLFEIIQDNPHRDVLYLITACELTLEMFGNYGNMVAAPGLGVRLDGRICNTMRAFELSEEGIKPGLTVVLPKTQNKIKDLLSSLN